jgi:hypothetical protein
MMKKTKRGSIGLTLSWMVAFIIIFCFLILFVILTSFLAGKRAVFSEGNEISSEFSGGVLDSQRKFEFFLRMPVESNGEIILLSDLIKTVEIKDCSRNCGEVSRLFSLVSNQFIQKYFLKSSNRGFGAWIKGYSGESQAIDRDRIAWGLGKGIGGQVEERNFYGGDIICGLEKDFKLKFHPILFEYYFGKNKIVFCVNKMHLADLRNKK